MTAQRTCSIVGPDEAVRRTLSGISATLGRRGTVSIECVESDFSSWYRAIIRIGQAVGVEDPTDANVLETKIRERLALGDEVVAPHPIVASAKCPKCGSVGRKFSTSVGGVPRLSCEACGHMWTDDPQVQRALTPPVDPLRSSSALVDHPAHYNSSPSGVEAIDVIEHMTFNVGSAVKYCWRHGLKPGTDAVTDLKKAIWYLQREVERLSK